jgi:hypothetical protein
VALWFSCYQKPLNYLAFHSFDYESWSRLLQKCVVCTKLDIYVFIKDVIIPYWLPDIIFHLLYDHWLQQNLRISTEISNYHLLLLQIKESFS